MQLHTYASILFIFQSDYRLDFELPCRFKTFLLIFSFRFMASTSNRTGGDSFYGGATPYRSSVGLSTRPAASSDEIQVRIDPMHADLDDEITGLRSQVKQLRNVAQEIGSEAKFQKDFLDQLVFINAKCTFS